MSFLHGQNKIMLSLALTVALAALVPNLVAARNPKIRVTVGQSVTQLFTNNVKTVSIADSDVADVVVAGPREVLINGKAIGFTTTLTFQASAVEFHHPVVRRLF